MAEAPRAYDEGETLLSRLAVHARERPSKLAFTFLGSRGQVEAQITYAELHAWACNVSANLSRAFAPGERAVLLLPSGLEFIAAFLGCLDAGLAAVPCSVPNTPQATARLTGIINDCAAACVITSEALGATFAHVQRESLELSRSSWITIEAASAAPSTNRRPSPGSANQVAFIQYTSGSTSTPKGVLVSHDNLAANERMIQQAFEHDLEAVIVGWLPLFHDQGLIGNVCQPLWVGAHCVLMAPYTFLKRPWLWMHAISHYRATTSGGPNFAYEHVLRTLTKERMNGVNLGTWRLAFNGAEPIQPKTLERFSAALGAYGFRSEAHYPCYGLAEATLFVTGGWAAGRGLAHEYSREGLERGVARRLERAPSVPVVRCGRPARGLTLRIVRDGRECTREQIGEIWLSGASVAMGYWNKPEETRQSFDNRINRAEDVRYLRTGDLGFVDEFGDLFVTGRSKDVMIIEGKNHYAHDIEHTAQGCDHRLCAGAAFSIQVEGSERAIVVQEVRAGSDVVARKEIASSIRRAVRDEHGLGLHEVILLGQGQVPKTTSGKVRRSEAKRMFLVGVFAVEE